MPKISVIVPVYNMEHCMRRCLDSLLQQTYTDYEVLLIDDGSKDSSGAICDEYAASDPRIRVFHKPNGGVSSARNLGLDNARGVWVTFVDSDDWIDKDYLSTLLIGKDSDLSVCSFKIEGSDEVWPTEIPNGLQNRLGIKHILEQQVLDASFSASWCKLYNLNTIKINNLRFNPDISSAEDTLFFLTYLQYCDSIYCINAQLYHYNRAVEGLSKSANGFANGFFAYTNSLNNVLPRLSEKFNLRIEVLSDYVLSSRIPSNLMFLSHNLTNAKSVLNNIRKCKIMNTLMQYYYGQRTTKHGRRFLVFYTLYGTGHYKIAAYYLMLLSKL